MADIENWRMYGMHIDNKHFLFSQSIFEVPDELSQQLREQIREEGYFQLPPQNFNLPLEKMAEVISDLHANNIPAVFAFIYDEYWVLYLRLHKMIQSILGEDYIRRPNFFAWYIDPKNNAAGFSPHREYPDDNLRLDGLPNELTVWIPLTNSTPLNGCISVLPANLDSTYNTEDRGTYKFKLQDIRALPSDAGGVLAWNFSLLHWGGQSCKRAENPRISVSLEFQSKESASIKSEISDISNPILTPSFNNRLRHICHQIFTFKDSINVTEEELLFYKLLSEKARDVLSK